MAVLLEELIKIQEKKVQEIERKLNIYEGELKFNKDVLEHLESLKDSRKS